MMEPLPLYEKVKRHITDGIARGAYAPGTRLPSENELVEKIGASRMTVSRALRELTRDGIIYRTRGVGSFVSEAGPNTSLSEVRDIIDIVAERGGVYSCRVLTAETVRLSAFRANLFGLEGGEAVSKLEIVHFEGDSPLQFERRYVREDFAPELLSENFETRSLFKYLQAIAPISELEHVVEATAPDAEEADRLQLAPGVPVLRIRRRTWVGPTVVTLGYFSHPGDRYRVAVRVRPSDARTPATPAERAVARTAERPSA